MGRPGLLLLLLAFPAIGACRTPTAEVDHGAWGLAQILGEGRHACVLANDLGGIDVSFPVLNPLIQNPVVLVVAEDRSFDEVLSDLLDSKGAVRLDAPAGTEVPKDARPAWIYMQAVWRAGYDPIRGEARPTASAGIEVHLEARVSGHRVSVWRDIREFAVSRFRGEFDVVDCATLLVLVETSGRDLCWLVVEMPSGPVNS